MFNTSNMSRKMIDRMFRRIEGVVMDLSTGKLGIQDANGIYTLDEVKSGEGEAATSQFSISVNPFEAFSIPLPAFATQIPLDKVKPGDIVVNDKGISGWVTEVKGASLNVIDKNGHNKNITPVTLKISIGGSNGVLVVQNLFNLAGDGIGSLQGTLMPLLMMGDDVDLNSILPMVLMTQSQSGPNAVSSMLPMLMALGGGKSDKSTMDRLLPLMMMGGFGGGQQGGMNPMMLMAMSGGLDGLGASKKAIAPANANAIGAAPALQPITRR